MRQGNELITVTGTNFDLTKQINCFFDGILTDGTVIDSITIVCNTSCDERDIIQLLIFGTWEKNFALGPQFTFIQHSAAKYSN